MKKKLARLVFGASLACVALMLVVVTVTPPAAFAQQQTTPGGTVLGPTGYVSINENIVLSPTYDFVGSGSNYISATLTVPSMRLAVNASVEVLSSFRASHFTEVATVNGANATIPYQVFSGRFGIYFGYDSIVPANATFFRASISGNQGGDTFLYRYIATVPLVSLSGFNNSVATSETLVVPHGSVLSQQYDSSGIPLDISTTPPVKNNSTATTYLLNLNANTVVMQSTDFVPASIAITVVALGIVVLAGLNLFPRGRIILSKAASPFKRIVPSTGAGSSFSRRMNSAQGIVGLFQPRRLLGLFLLCAMLMVAFAAVSGPDPRLKAYVMADPSSLNQITAQLDQAHGNVFVITPSEDYSDISTMASIGMVNMLVISNYPTLQLPEVTKFILPAIGSGDIPLVVIDKTADPGFVAQIKALVPPDEIVTVGNVSNMNSNETDTLRTFMSGITRSNVAGLAISSTGFKLVEVVEAVLSFVLILVGWAYLGSLAMDATAQSDLAHLATVIAAGVFVFVFSEVIYVATSAMLAMPISLHAVVSGSHSLTAVGLLGFGGGSTPRLAAGFIGFVIGMMGSGMSTKIRMSDFALIGGIVLIILASPFYLGQFAFQGLLLFGSSNYAFGGAFASSLTFKAFLYGIGAVLGGSVSATYVMSAGKILFFAGLVPFAYLKKMGRTTTALAMLFVGLLVGDGGVRVGELTPEKTVVAILPGIVAGFVLLIPLIGLALAEKYVRGKWK